MVRFKEYISSQFGNPRGIVGKICCLIMNVMNRVMYRSVVKELLVDEHSKVLEIGYGNGYLIEKLYKIRHPYIWGIDISKDMQEIAGKRNKKALAADKLKLLVGDCCALQFKNDFFDRVTSINTIYFWKSTLKGLEEIHRVLKKDGVFINVVYSKEWLQRLSYTKYGFKIFEKDELIKLGKEAGFSEVIIKDIVHGKSYLVIYKK